MFEIYIGLHIAMLLEINKQDRIEWDLFDFDNKNTYPSIRGTSVRILLITSSLCWCVAGADCSRNGKQRPPRSRTTTRSRTGANTRHLLRGLSSLRSLLLPLLGESSHGGGNRTVPLQGATSGSSVRHFFVSLVDVQTVTKFAKQISFMKQTEYLSQFSISRYLPSKLINLVNSRGGDYTLIFRCKRIRLEINNYLSVRYKRHCTGVAHAVETVGTAAVTCPRKNTTTRGRKYSLERGCWMKGGLLRGVTATLCRQRACSRVDCRTQSTQSRKVLGYLASLWEFSQFLQLSNQFNSEIKRTIPSFRFFSSASNRRQINSYFATQGTRPPFSAAPPEFNEKANSTCAILLYTLRSTYSKTVMEVLSHLTCSYAIKSGPDFSGRREVWLFGYTTGNLEVNAIVDSFLCLVNGTKKLVNVLTAVKDIGFDPPVTSAYLRLCSLKSEKKRRFAKDASRTCRTSDLKSSLGDAFSLNKSCNEVPRQTLVTGSPPSSFLKCAKFYVSL
ncbi:hypothetical protein ALC53_01185 [Atta colombica]|uniref:Uncharacterized protein n=1 Tax=Atta colombica TaxID=520822 RepID=A0A195BU65_9HYME|nr:hypothetical protein ALC53_01185 [Atta colombica]